MPSIVGTLCIDFGTSSIRAALSDDDRLRPRALKLGDAFRSSIDSASIPSAIFIDADGSRISFGENALLQGLTGEKSILFEMSPKRWMTAEPPTTLDQKIFAGSDLNRKHLLAGLLAHSFSATYTAAGISKANLLQLDTRVAHPVWNPADAPALRQHLSWITEIGRHLSGVTDQAISPGKLLAAINGASCKATDTLLLDVEEPVAAALELFKNSGNSREICVVVDVGAGTTDLGVFLSLTPDERNRRHRRKFIRAASPRSIFMAGDFIDKEVINLIKSRARNLRGDADQDLQRRRRTIKETLFSRAERVYEAGVVVTLKDLEEQVRIRQMRDELAQNFKILMDEASGFIRPFVEASFHQADQINVIFAGGGSNIGFLHQAIGSSWTLANGRTVPVAVRAALVQPTLPASVERLAVAMGGTTPADDWPVTRLGSPKELITEWDRARPAHASEVESRSSDWWREQP